VRLEASITRRGVTHGSLVSDPEGFTLRIVDADDPSTVLYSIAEPRERFATTASSPINCAHFCPPDPPPTATAASGRQLDAFLRPNGTVQQFCAGVCDPE